ncbi:MAG TPA: hypothetical protein VHO91_10530 [Rhodopila sp.]|nr:hypothetical protein [Rhodopila sp.]
MIVIAGGRRDHRCPVPDAGGMKLAMSIGRRTRDKERDEQRECADQAPCRRFLSPVHCPAYPQSRGLLHQLYYNLGRTGSLIQVNKVLVRFSAAAYGYPEISRDRLVAVGSGPLGSTHAAAAKAIFGDSLRARACQRQHRELRCG